MARKLELLAVLLAGAAAGAAVMRIVGEPAAPVPEDVVRDLVVQPGMSAEVAEQHRAADYRALDTVPDILALPTPFARSAALHALAGRSDAAALQGHIFAADRIADDAERDNALGILFFRLAELDPASALALARTPYFASAPELENGVWRAWARLDLDDALFAAKTGANARERNKAAQALYAAFGFMGNPTTDRIEAELGVGPDRLNRSRYLYRLADRSPAAAIDYIDAMRSGTEKVWNVNWIAYYLSLGEARGALAHARHFDEKRYRDQYESIVLAEAAREDPVATLEKYLAATRGQAWSPDLHAALTALAENDPELLLTYIERARSDEARMAIAAVYVEALVRRDPAAALQWARENNVAGPYGQDLLMTAVLKIAQEDPALAFETALGLPAAEMKHDILQSVLGTIAGSDPHLALSMLEEIPTVLERNNARNSVLGQWLHNDPDAAIAYLDSLDPAEAEAVISETGLMLAHRDPEMAMRLLPKVSEEYRPMWRATIAERLAATRGAAEAMAFIQRFENEPGYADLQATVVGGLANRDLDAARQLADQLPNAEARDPAMAQIVGQQARYDPAAAAAELGRIADEEHRANAATSVAHYWFQADPPAATRWLLSQPPGRVRDQVVRDAVNSVTDLTPEILGLVDQIADPDVRGQAKAGVAWQLVREDPAAARRMLEDGDIPDYLRQSIEQALDHGGR